MEGDLQPTPGKVIPAIRGQPIRMTMDANKAPSKNVHKAEPGCWQVSGRRARQDFRPANPAWRPGRANQNRKDMAEAKLRKYQRSCEMTVRPQDIKSQLAWQKLQRMEVNALLTLGEIEEKGFELPNFSNVRERVSKRERAEPPYDEAVESLSSSDAMAGLSKPQQDIKEARELSAEESKLRQQWIEEDSPPKMMRVVERQNWNWTLDKASALEVNDLVDPLFLCLEQWNRIVKRGGAFLYAASVDKRWPGYHNQPWFVNEQEVVEAWEERRISKEYKKLCCKLIMKFGDCLNTTQKTMFRIPDFDVMLKTRNSTIGWESPPENTPQKSDEDRMDGTPGSSTDRA
jgi:hypothetical protein